MTTHTTIAALVQTESMRVDAMLYQALLDRKQAGWNIHGLVAVPEYSEARQPIKSTTVENLQTGEHHTILQSRGTGARGCRLNPYVLTEAGQALRNALNGVRPDLAVINRFGSSEAEGRGFCTEIIDLVSANIPLLLVVTDRYLDAWRHFIGDSQYELAANSSALNNWLDNLPEHTACT